MNPDIDQTRDVDATDDSDSGHDRKPAQSSNPARNGKPAQGDGRAPGGYAKSDGETQNRWSRDDSGILDDSIANTLRHVVLAVGGMFLAFAAAEWVNAWLWSGSSGVAGFFVRGATFCVFGAGSIYVTSARPIRTALIAQRDAIDVHEAELRASSDRHRLVGRLQSAFDMAESDRDAFTVVGNALGVVAAEHPGELLLADSSRAHLRRVTSSCSSCAAGCGVETPWVSLRCGAVALSPSRTPQNSTHARGSPNDPGSR